MDEPQLRRISARRPVPVLSPLTLPRSIPFDVGYVDVEDLDATFLYDWVTVRCEEVQRRISWPQVEDVKISSCRMFVAEADRSALTMRCGAPALGDGDTAPVQGMMRGAGKHSVPKMRLELTRS